MKSRKANIILIILIPILIFTLHGCFFHEVSELDTQISEKEQELERIEDIVVYLNSLSEISRRYDEMYDLNNDAAKEAIKSNDDQGFEYYIYEIIESENKFYNELNSLDVPEELENLHQIDLERLSAFIEYLPYQIKYHYDNSKKDERDAMYSYYSEKKLELYNEYQRIKAKYNIDTDFTTVFNLKKPD